MLSRLAQLARYRCTRHIHRYHLHSKSALFASSRAGRTNQLENNSAAQYNLKNVSNRSVVDSHGTHHGSGDSIIKHWAAKRPTILSLSDIITYTGSTDDKMHEYGKFIWNEIPIRISHRIDELSSLPYNLSNTSSIRELRELYTHSFHLFRMLEAPDNDETEQKFIDTMKTHFDSLKSAVLLVAHGLSQCIHENPSQASTIQACPFLNGFLDRFHAARLGMIHN